MPSEERVRRHDSRDLHQKPSPDSLALGSQPPSLIIVQPRSLAQLLAKNPTLFPLVQADQALSLREHACQTEEHQLERPKHVMHDASLPDDR